MDRIVTLTNGKTYLVGQTYNTMSGLVTEYWTEKNGARFGATRTASHNAKAGSVAAQILAAVAELDAEVAETETVETPAAEVAETVAPVAAKAPVRKAAKVTVTADLKAAATAAVKGHATAAQWLSLEASGLAQAGTLTSMGYAAMYARV